MAYSSKLNEWELEAVKEFKTAWDTNRSIKDSVLAIGRSIQYLCKGLYKRKLKKEPGNKEWNPIVRELEKEGVLTDSKLVIKVDEIRKIRNEAEKNVRTNFNTQDIDIYRRDMVVIFKMYQGVAQVKFENLRLEDVIDKLLHTPISAIENLWKEGLITEDEKKRQIQKEKFVKYKVEDKGKPRDEVSFVALLIDVSGSMTGEEEHVVEGHARAIEAIRGSRKAKKNSLFLMQSLFNHISNDLNASLTIVNQDGNDKVALLNRSTYRPNGDTALRDTIYDSLHKLNIELDAFKNRANRPAKAHIGVITDGVDTCSKEASEDMIKKLVIGLRKRKELQKAVLIGWTSSGFSKEHLEKLCDNLGFNEYIAIDKSDPRAIRRAFDLWSKSVVDF